MILIEQIPEQELQRLKKKTTGNFWGTSLTMILATIGFGLVFGRMDVAIGCSLLIVLIFFIIAITSPSAALIKGNMKITRRNSVIDARLERSGFKTKTTTIHIVLAKDDIPDTYTQTDTFMVYHSWGHLAGIANVTRHNYQQLIGKEVEIVYMADNGFVIGFNLDNKV